MLEKQFSKQKPTRGRLINNYLKIGLFSECKPWSSSCVNELCHRLSKDHWNLKLDWGVWCLLRPSKIHSGVEGWVKCLKGTFCLCFFPFPWVFFFHGLIKLSGEIRGGFGNKTINCHENYLFCYTLYVWNTIYFFGDILQGKELNNDLLSLSGNTTLNNWLDSAAEMRWNNCKYTAFLKAGEEGIFFLIC